MLKYCIRVRTEDWDMLAYSGFPKKLNFSKKSSNWNNIYDAKVNWEKNPDEIKIFFILTQFDELPQEIRVILLRLSKRAQNARFKKRRKNKKHNSYLW
jgi:TRAP-type mannitol/chloroaromatic compound transport system substrate-binding protein